MASHLPSPSDSRGEGRPVRRRTRTFRPNYLSFSGTYQCNLTCPHCSVPIEWPDRLDIDIALRFLEQAHAEGIEIVSFTGGEPMLYPEFVVAITRRAAELGMRFDKVQTNGVWYRDEPHLRAVLTDLHQAGFTGKLGLSVDKFHGKHTHEAAVFCRIAREVFDRDSIVSLSYASRAPDVGLEPVHALARELDAVVDWSDLLHRYLLVSPELTIVVNWNHLAPVERAEKLGSAWDGTWFEEDYCEGPGQALIVTPKGDVKPCCGFASDLDELTIGNIHRDSVRDIIQRGRKDPYVGTIFRKGLTAIRDEILAQNPDAFPGATSNHCYFCWYVLTRGMAGHRPEGRPTFALPVVQLPTLALQMRFDGRTVFLGETIPTGPGREYRLTLHGPGPLTPPPPRQTWDEYQTWITARRAEGFTLKTDAGGGCG
ncbi:MAG: radical SAM/SPASM domain-containing protein [Gemmataceae bacterium]